MKEYITKAVTEPRIPSAKKSAADDTICLECLNDRHDRCHLPKYAWASCSCWQEWNDAGRPMFEGS